MRRIAEGPPCRSSKRNIEGSVGTICLDHYEKRNALSAALVEETLTAVENFAAERVRAVVLRAKPGVTIWSAGRDVGELPEARRDPLGWYDPLRRLIRAIETHPAPVIAMIEGGVWGGRAKRRWRATSSSPPRTRPSR